MTTTTTTIQSRRDTTANWKSVNPKPKAGELCYETDLFKRAKIGDGSTNWNSLKHLLDSDEMAFAAFINGRYEGKNLATVHATEISGYSNVYAWLEARRSAGNFEGINVNDYIDIAHSGGTCGGYTINSGTKRARIAGINMYKGFWDGVNNVSIGNHIDFFFDTGFANIPMQTSNNNNGTSENQNPWKSSIVYAVANGVNNLSTNAYNSVSHGVDASGGGIVDLLPDGLKAVLKPQVFWLPKRYSANGLLTESNSWEATDMGKLRAYSEVELNGSPIHSMCKNASDGVAYDIGGQPMQYPLFKYFAGNPGHRANGAHFWTSSCVGGSSSRFCTVLLNGYADAIDASSTVVSARLGFRI